MNTNLEPLKTFTSFRPTSCLHFALQAQAAVCHAVPSTPVDASSNCGLGAKACLTGGAQGMGLSEGASGAHTAGTGVEKPSSGPLLRKQADALSADILSGRVELGIEASGGACDAPAPPRFDWTQSTGKNRRSWRTICSPDPCITASDAASDSEAERNSDALQLANTLLRKRKKPQAPMQATAAPAGAGPAPRPPAPQVSRFPT